MNTFYDLVRQWAPIGEIRANFAANEVAGELHLPNLFFYLNHSTNRAIPIPWLKEFLTYLFDECATDVNQCYTGTFLRPLDFAMYEFSGNLICVVVDFLLARGATSYYKLEILLNHYHNCRGYNDVLFKRLIDAGAKPLFEGLPSQLYHFRLSTRSVCIALLSLPWKLPSGHRVRQWLPRDLQRLVARMIWSQRFKGGRV